MSANEKLFGDGEDWPLLSRSATYAQEEGESSSSFVILAMQGLRRPGFSLADHLDP
jgi:hypothetical protein